MAQKHKIAVDQIGVKQGTRVEFKDRASLIGGYTYMDFEDDDYVTKRTLTYSAVTASNGLTKTDEGDIRLGGDLSYDTTINLAGRALLFNGSSSTLQILATGAIQQPLAPVDAFDLVNKNYIDNYVTGITWKQEVRAGTTANITLSGTQTVDGVSLVVGNRVLVKNQTTQSQNGIWVVSAGAWTRSADADTTEEIEGATVMVRLGTLNKDTQWTNTNTNEPVIGTDAITFAQIAGAGTYTSDATTITLTGNVFSLNTTYTDARYILNQNGLIQPTSVFRISGTGQANSFTAVVSVTGANIGATSQITLNASGAGSYGVVGNSTAVQTRFGSTTDPDIYNFRFLNNLATWEFGKGLNGGTNGGTVKFLTDVQLSALSTGTLSDNVLVVNASDNKVYKIASLSTTLAGYEALLTHTANQIYYGNGTAAVQSSNLQYNAGSNTLTNNNTAGTATIINQSGTPATGSSSNVAEIQQKTIGSGGGYFSATKWRQYTDGTNAITELTSGSASSLYPLLLNGGLLYWQSLGNYVWTDDNLNRQKNALSVFSTNTSNGGQLAVYSGDLFAMPDGTFAVYNSGSATNAPSGAGPGTIRQYWRDANIRSLRYEDLLGNSWMAATSTYPTGLTWVQSGTAGGIGGYIQNQFTSAQSGAGLWTAGNGRFDTGLNVNGAFTVNSSGTAVTSGVIFGNGGIGTNSGGSTVGSFYANGGSAISTTSGANNIFGGASMIGFRAGFLSGTTFSLSLNNSYANMLVASSPVTTFTSGTHAWVANAVVKAVGTITNAGAAVTNTASLLINSAGTGGTNNYAMAVISGTSLFGGSIQNSTLTASQAVFTDASKNLVSSPVSSFAWTTTGAQTGLTGNKSMVGAVFTFGPPTGTYPLSQIGPTSLEFLSAASTFYGIANNGFEVSNGGFFQLLSSAGLTANRAITIPDATGTIAMTNFKIATKTANYAVVDEQFIKANATGGAFAVTLPDASSSLLVGRYITIKKSDSSGNSVTVNTTSSQTIDGVTTFLLSAQYKYITVVSDGANWLIIANN